MMNDRELAVLRQGEKIIDELRELLGFAMRDREALLALIEEHGDARLLHAATEHLRAIRASIGVSVH